MDMIQNLTQNFEFHLGSVISILEWIVLTIFILFTILYVVGLRQSVVSHESVFPASLLHFPLLIISLAIVIGFHWSPFHLIWMFFLTFLLAIVAIITGVGQSIAMGIMYAFSLTRFDTDERDDEDMDEAGDDGLIGDEDENGIVVDGIVVNDDEDMNTVTLFMLDEMKTHKKKKKDVLDFSKRTRKNEVRGFGS